MTHDAGQPDGREAGHPRDRFLTLYGRKPVLEALEDRDIPVEKVLIDRRARGPEVDAAVEYCRSRGIGLRRVEAREVTRLSRNGRQDQGFVADVRAPRMTALAEASLPPRGAVLLLDGLTTPANVGMILRTATAAGLAGIVVPRAGSPEIGPLVIKASAGVALRAPILRTPDAATGAATLRAAGYTLVGLRAREAADLYRAALPDRVAFVLGGETLGVSPAVTAATDLWLRIPLAGGVESLNVAAAAAVVCFEWARRAAPAT